MTSGSNHNLRGRVDLLPCSFPLRIEKLKDDGWIFIACDGIPGLSVFGTDIDELFNQLELAGVDLLSQRGRFVKKLTVEPVRTKRDSRIWGAIDQFELRAA